MTFDDVRKLALTWPEVHDGTSYGTAALKVRKELRHLEGRRRLAGHAWRSARRARDAVREPSALFYFTDHYRDYPTVLIRLSKATRSHVEPLLRRRWRELASKAAVKKFDAEV